MRVGHPPLQNPASDSVILVLVAVLQLLLLLLLLLLVAVDLLRRSPSHVLRIRFGTKSMVAMPHMLLLTTQPVATGHVGKVMLEWLSLPAREASLGPRRVVPLAG